MRKRGKLFFGHHCHTQHQGLRKQSSFSRDAGQFSPALPQTVNHVGHRKAAQVRTPFRLLSVFQRFSFTRQAILCGLSQTALPMRSASSSSPTTR